MMLKYVAFQKFMWQY